MTIARGVAVGALASGDRRWSCVLLLRGGNTHEYDASSSRTPASSSRATTSRSAAAASARSSEITLTDDNQARSRRGRRALRAAARGHARRSIRADLAVGHRQPLHRADARRRNTAKQLDDGATLGVGHDDLASSTSTRSSTRSTRRRAEPAGRHPGLRDAVRRPAARRPGSPPSTSTRSLSTSRRLVNQLDRRTSGTLDRLHRQLLARRHRASPSAATTSPPSSATRTRRRRAIARENASLSQALGLLPTTLRRANTTFVNLRATLDDLDPLVDASKPATKDLAPFLRELRPLVASARPDGPRPAPLVIRSRARTTTWSTRRARCRSLQRVAQPVVHALDRRRCVKSPAGARVHPALLARPDRLVPRLRPGRRRTTTPTATTRASSRSSTPSRSPTTPDGGVLAPQSRSTAVRRPADRTVAALPGRRQPAAGGRLRAVHRQRQPRRRRLRPEPRAARSLMKRVATVALLLVARRRRGADAPARGDGGTYKVRAIFDNAGFVIPGEDVKVAGVKVGKVDSLDVTPRLQGGRRARHRRPGVPGLPHRRRAARSARSR